MTNSRSSILSIFLYALIGVALAIKGAKVGGWTNVSTRDRGVQTVASYASDVISDGSNSFYLKKLIHIHSAQRQVVAGWKYNVTFDMATTICRKNEVAPETVNQCTISPTHDIERCTATIWEQPWIKEKQLLSQKCSAFLSYANYFSEANVAQDQAEHDLVGLD